MEVQLYLLWSSSLPFAHRKSSISLAYKPEMSNKNHNNLAKLLEGGTVGRWTWSFDSDESMIWCHLRFLLRRLSLPLKRRPSQPGERTCSSKYFDLVLIKRCVKPASAIVFACPNHLVAFYQTKNGKSPAEARVIVDERENEEVWELSAYVRAISEDLYEICFDQPIATDLQNLRADTSTAEIIFHDASVEADKGNSTTAQQVRACCYI